MQLPDLVGKPPSKMTDEEINNELHRLRTSRVVEGKIVGQTKLARKKTAAVKALMKIGLSETQAIAAVDEEYKKEGIAANDGVDLGTDETIIS